MKKIISTLAFILIISGALAQSITGDWYGLIKAGGNSLHLVLHISKTGDTYTTTMDSPDQGAKGIPTDKTTVTGDVVEVEAPKFGIKYRGTYQPDKKIITGTFTQGGDIPLILTRDNVATAVVAPAPRPQDPKDFPYKQEDVAFENTKSGNRLAGTLTIPSNGKVSKIVILISGSGPQNRNEELFNHRPFLVWSDWLTRHGIAVLRYDDRGVAKSTGNFSAATTADFADDAEAAVTFIKSRTDLKGLSIGLMGHSEGGIIAPLVASRNPSVKFVVMLAGPGVPIVQLMAKQSADQMRLSGTPDTTINRIVGNNRNLYAAIVQNASLPIVQLKQALDSVISHSTGLTSAEKTAMIGSEAGLIAPWFRYFMGINPATYLTKVKCPVLALNGTMDKQVDSETNLAAVKANLTVAGNKHYEIVPLDGLNHLFQKATTGGVPEYEQISETVNPAALEKVVAWINQLKF
jgi:alpha-beta hydrolase superfamily lysophospholipase